MTETPNAPNILSWVDLSRDEVEHLYSVDKPSCRATVGEKVKAIVSEQNEDRQNIIADMLYHVVQIAKKNRFTPEKCSILFALFRATHDFAKSSPHSTMKGTLEYFRSALERHHIQRPPWSEAIFTLEESSLILEYALETYFRHFKLYKYAFTNQQKLDINLIFSDHIDELPLENESTIRSDGGEASESQDMVITAEDIQDEAEATSKKDTDDTASDSEILELLASEEGQRLQEYINAAIEEVGSKEVAT